MRYLALLLCLSALRAQVPSGPAQVPVDVARVQFFQAMPEAVQRGGTVTLRWSASGADRVRIEPLNQDYPAQGEVTAVIRDRTTFWLHVFNLKGSQSFPVVVQLLPDLAPAAPPARPPAALAKPGAWIQFAVLSDPGNIAKLRKALQRRVGIAVLLSRITQAGAPGPPAQRLRLGPFATANAARRRLRQLQPRLRPLRLRPIISLDA